MEKSNSAPSIISPYSTIPSSLHDTQYANIYELEGPLREIEGVFKVHFYRVYDPITLQAKSQLFVLYNPDKYTSTSKGKYTLFADCPYTELNEIPLLLIGYQEFPNYSIYGKLPIEGIHNSVGRVGFSNVPELVAPDFQCYTRTPRYMELGASYTAITNKDFSGDVIISI